jgi:hypothetical protein
MHYISWGRQLGHGYSDVTLRYSTLLYVTLRYSDATQRYSDATLTLLWRYFDATLTQIIIWRCSDATLTLLWRYSDATLTLLWRYFDATLTLLWRYSDSDYNMTLLWRYSDATLTLLWRYSVATIIFLCILCQVYLERRKIDDVLAKTWAGRLTEKRHSRDKDILISFQIANSRVNDDWQQESRNNLTKFSKWATWEKSKQNSGPWQFLLNLDIFAIV